MIHCTFRGRQYDYTFDEVFDPNNYTAIGIPEGVEASPQTITQEQVKTALAQKFDVGIGEFSDSYVEINPNGNITVRPNAVFG